jgi:C1A family cysteine protease
MGAFKLTWQPDSTQPLPVGQTAFNDQKLADNLGALQAVASTMPNAISEVNGILDLRPFCPPVDNQGQVGDCVADGTCSGLEFVQIRAGLPFVKLSRLFLYYNARLQTQSTGLDGGTYIRLAFATLTSLGTCPETVWTYDPAMVFTRPSWAAYQAAYPNKITSFFSIDPTVVSAHGAPLVAAIKSALQAQHPVVFGMVVDDAYQLVGSNGKVALPLAKRVGPGGHCQLICGYNDNTQCWIVKNSWGTTWGDQGYAYVPYAYLDASSVNDCWIPFLQGSTP